VSTFSRNVSGDFFTFFADTYEEAVQIAEDFYLKTGYVVAVEKVSSVGSGHA